jgi:uncharacterized protein
MNDFLIAGFTGLAGSLHCLGMCGPLAFAVPSQKSGWRLFAEKGSYQLGRTLSYILLGLIAGLVGRQFWVSGVQQVIGTACGIVVAGMGTYGLFKRSPVTFSLTFFPAHWLGRALKSRQHHLVIGALNGFLPCGMVWLALAGAVTRWNVWGGVLYMACFGLGTWPLMLAATFGFRRLPQQWRRRWSQVMPCILVLLGGWIVVRSLVVNHPASTRDTEEVSVCR